LHPACRIWFLASKLMLGLIIYSLKYRATQSLFRVCRTNMSAYNCLDHISQNCAFIGSIGKHFGIHAFVNSSILNNTRTYPTISFIHSFMKYWWISKGITIEGYNKNFFTNGEINQTIPEIKFHRIWIDHTHTHTHRYKETRIQYARYEPSKYVSIVIVTINIIVIHDENWEHFDWKYLIAISSATARMLQLFLLSILF